MDNPFDMSFEEIMAQATANMEADRGESNSSPKPTAEEKAAPVQNTTGEKTFLEMVEEAEKGKETKTENPPESGIPAGMSFEDLEKQAKPPMNPPVEEKPAENVPDNELSFEAMMAKAQAAAATPTFDDMFKQAQGNTAPQSEIPKAEETVKEEPKREESVKEELKAEPFNQPVTGGTSFDDLVAQAEQMAGTPIKEEPVKEESKQEESKQEELVKEEPVKEEPVKEEPVKEEPVKEEPVKEESEQEESKQGKSKKGKKSADKKEDGEPKEVLPDITSEYEVDLSGNGKSSEKPAEKEIQKPVSSEKTPLTLDNLFSEDEIEAFRLMIHLFVRREFKRAMVGAMTDILSEFKDE